MTIFGEQDVRAASTEAEVQLKSNQRIIRKGGTPE